MTDRLELVDVVSELTQHTNHRETYEHDQTGTHARVVEAPSLIAQLRLAMTQSAAVDGGTKPGFGSKPSARLDALDALLRIDQGAVRWLHLLIGVGDRMVLPRRLVNADTEVLVWKLHAAGSDSEPVERDIRAWWLHARIATGWDTPAFRPHNTCPTCKKRGGLRVRVDREDGVLVRHGLCVECKAQWTGEEGTFEQLAWHIRVENCDLVPVSGASR